MDRRAAIAVLTGTIVAVLFAAIATAGEVKLADGAPSFARDTPEAAPDNTIVPMSTVLLGSNDGARLELPAFVEIVLGILFYGCAAVLAMIVLAYGWRHRPTLSWRPGRRRRSVDFDVVDDVATSITADAAAQRAALLNGAPRNAIVECWLRLEAAVVDAGVHRDPADTSAELTERVLARHHVDPAALAHLAALYREARFSDHSMDEDDRRRAIDALDAVHRGLRSHLSQLATAT